MYFVFNHVLGHMATMGCSKCKKKFPGGIGKKVYSGFNRNDWIPRTNVLHRAQAHLIKNCKLKTKREQLESKYGTRYSVLLQLDYFDIIKMVTIDPMHNLFIGMFLFFSIYFKKNSHSGAWWF